MMKQADLQLRHVATLLVVLSTATAALAGEAVSDNPLSKIRVVLELPRPPNDTGRFKLKGWSSSQLKSLTHRNKQAQPWSQDFSVYVAGNDTGTPLFGRYCIEKQTLVFEPRFALVAGLTYRVVIRPSLLERPADPLVKAIDKTFTLPERPRSPAARVTHVFPSRNRLPENQLKFYIHFSAPMSRGEAYRRIHLLDAAGKRVPFPFLELNEELWDPTGTRFTLLFDPGRIKRGLKPRRDVGPSIEAGKTYSLRIDPNWKDAHGQPLERLYHKKFHVAAPDLVQPDPAAWKIVAPRVDSRAPLVVLFNEPLDHAMLQRVITIQHLGGEPIEGQIAVDREETRWQLRPTLAWRSGRYHLLVDTTLEDMAGNSVGRPFEVDIFDKVEKRIRPKTVRRAFQVEGRE